MTPPPLSNPTSHFLNRDHFPTTQSLISDQNQELYIVEADAIRHKKVIAEQHHDRDLSVLMNDPNPYDKLLTMFLGNQLSQETEHLADEPSKCCVLASGDKLMPKIPCQESTRLTSQSETLPEDKGLYGAPLSILSDRFPDPASPVTDSYGAGFPKLYIQEEGDEPIRSSVCNSVLDVPAQEVDHTVVVFKVFTE